MQVFSPIFLSGRAADLDVSLIGQHESAGRDGPERAALHESGPEAGLVLCHTCNLG